MFLYGQLGKLSAGFRQMKSNRWFQHSTESNTAGITLYELYQLQLVSLSLAGMIARKAFDHLSYFSFLILMKLPKRCITIL